MAPFFEREENRLRIGFFQIYKAMISFSLGCEDVVFALKENHRHGERIPPTIKEHGMVDVGFALWLQAMAGPGFSFLAIKEIMSVDRNCIGSKFITTHI